MVLDALPDLEALLGREQRDMLLRLGVTHGERARVAIAEAFVRGDVRGVKSEAHALRGAVAPFGVGDLVASLAKAEKGDMVAREVDAAIASFVAGCRAALDA
ncbi:hypothetical protein [Sphingomonas sp.]|jgi:hypothetical protein|uniref:hypothetical protein n=1 Tax=Sphingomonas sp. TaxID=28214 RepID=UPI002D7EF187|nr:hypothetical protein [Sphingomonas sp.]HEU0045676.1 hypothetical protein [Sphingomonas sp.]